MDSEQVELTQWEIENERHYAVMPNGGDNYYERDEDDEGREWDEDAWAWAEHWRWAWSAPLLTLWRDSAYTLGDKLSVTGGRLRMALMRAKWRIRARILVMLWRTEDPNDIPF